MCVKLMWIIWCRSANQENTPAKISSSSFELGRNEAKPSPRNNILWTWWWTTLQCRYFPLSVVLFTLSVFPSDITLILFHPRYFQSSCWHVFWSTFYNKRLGHFIAKHYSASDITLTGLKCSTRGTICCMSESVDRRWLFWWSFAVLYYNIFFSSMNAINI